MKNFFIICATLLFTYGAFAQVPEKISYQAVVRNASNNLVTNQAVGMKISILQGSATGTAVYAETQTPTSNTNGLVSIEIGGGMVVSGTMSTINWSSGVYFVKTEIDPTGGTTYTITGTSQLLSVPYALYAKTSGSSTPGPQGPMGPIGPQGPAGTNGTSGIGYGGTSASAKTISLGSKTFAVPQGLAYIAGQRIRFVDQTNAANFLEGTITSYSTTSMVVNIDNTGGSGTIANWNLSVGGNLGTPGVTGTQGQAGANGQGVPTGGTTGQVLTKVDGTNYNTAWVTPSSGGGSNTFPNVELQRMNNSNQSISNLMGTSTNTALIFSGTNDANSTFTGGNSFDGSVFTVGSTGAGWYDINVQVKGVTNTNTISSVGVAFILDKNNSIGSSSISGSQWTSTFNLNTSGSDNRNVSTIRALLYLNANDNIRFRGQSWSTTTAAYTSTDGSTNITIVRLK